MKTKTILSILSAVFLFTLTSCDSQWHWPWTKLDTGITATPAPVTNPTPVLPAAPTTPGKKSVPVVAGPSNFWFWNTSEGRDSVPGILTIIRDAKDTTRYTFKVERMGEGVDASSERTVCSQPKVFKAPGEPSTNGIQPSGMVTNLWMYADGPIVLSTTSITATTNAPQLPRILKIIKENLKESVAWSSDNRASR